MSQMLFMPLLLDRKTWDKTKTLLFLSEFYVFNLSEQEKKSLNYCLPKDYTIIRREKIFEYVQPLVEELIVILEKELSQYQQVQYSHEYWHRFLFAWLEQYCALKYYQTMLYVNIKEQFPKDRFSTVIYENNNGSNVWNEFPGQVGDEEYYARFAKIGEIFFGLQVKKIIKEDSAEDTVKRQEQQCAPATSRKFFVKRFFQKGLSDKLLYRVFRRRAKRSVEVLYTNTYFRSINTIRMVTRSYGKIQSMADFKYEFGELRLDCSFRQRLAERFSRRAKNRETWEQVVLYFLAEELSVLFIEGYQYLHQVSMEYLKQYSALKVIRVFNDMWHSDVRTFCICLAKERMGIKLIGMQHGGNYGVIKNLHFIEKNREDIFYGWGNWATGCDYKLKYGPSEKLCGYDELKMMKGNYILYTGAWIPTKIGDLFFDVRDGRRYIKWQVQFFKQLNKESLSKVCVRNYFVDGGWNINGILQTKIPDIHIMSKNEKISNWEREKEFCMILSSCRLLICDHLSTTWLEALKANKPLLMFYPKEQYLYEESEIPYIRMMEDVGILLHSPMEAAETVNQISDNVDSWWNEPQRQAVVDIIKDRYISQEKDVVGWWVKELLRQSEEV